VEVEQSSDRGMEGSRVRLGVLRVGRVEAQVLHMLY